jgi:hypothetical protein
LPSDGRDATGIGRPSHSALAEGHPLVVKGEGDSHLSVSLYGLTEKTTGELAPLARSWNQPAEVSLTGSGFSNNGYDKYQRAYVLTYNDEGDPSELNLELGGSPDHPIINPAFVVKGWGPFGAALTINGKKVNRGNDFRFGHRKTVHGRDLIVWIKREAHEPIRFTLLPVNR